jgi:hypothetical protein
MIARTATARKLNRRGRCGGGTPARAFSRRAILSSRSRRDTLAE